MRELMYIEKDSNLIHYSGYEEEDLLPLENLMIEYLSRQVKHEAFFKKYAAKKFMKASIFVRDWIAKRNNAASTTEA